MPKELGKAGRADITGHLPGEQAEYGSAFARFLEGAGQLAPLQEGTYLDHSGNGSHTEVPGMQTESPGRHTDTEVGPAAHGGNGQAEELSAADTFLDSPFDQDALSPEPMLTPEPVGDDTQDLPAAEPEGLQALDAQDEPRSLLAEEPQMLEPGGESDGAEQPKSEGLLEPVQWEPSADTLHPDATASDDDEDEDDDDEVLDDTDKLPPRGGSLPTVRPEPHELSHRNVTIHPDTSADTGILEPAQQPPVVERIDLDELTPDGDEETGISIEAEQDVDEKITSKVDPRSDVDPRSADPGVRDTVNFYNQTQSLHEQRRANQGLPTIAPDAVSDARPLDLAPDATAPLPRPEPASPDTGFLDQDDLEDTDLLQTDSLTPEAPSLLAEDGVDDADRRDTDRFNEQDRHPDRLPRPEGTDKVEKDTGRHSAELEPIADEEVAAGKDTQRFYVAEILTEKPAKTGDTTAELEPAEEGPPPLSASSGDTASGELTHTQGDTRREPRPEPQTLPEPEQVDTDFVLRDDASPAERIIPEFATLEPSDEEDGDDTVDEVAELEHAEIQAEPVERITTRVRKVAPDPERESDKVVDWQAASAEEVATEPEPEAVSSEAAEPETAPRSDTEPALAPAMQPAVTREPTPAGASKITDSFSRRLREEREETMRLIEQAENVVVKLRNASEQSRVDLVAISSRRAAVGGNGHDHSLPERSRHPSPDEDPVRDDAPEAPPAETDEPLERDDEFATEIVSRRLSGDKVDSPDEPVASRRPRERVPTRAIGEIIDEIDRKSAASGPESLSALLDAVSRRHEPVPQTDATDEPPARYPVDDDDDLDYLAAASSRLRETLKRERDEAERSDRFPATQRYEKSEEHEFSRLSEPAAAPRHSDRHDAPGNRLSEDLDRLWEVLDSRRAPAVVLPSGEEPRMPPREEDPLDGWTQEALWRMLIGIAAVTFLLGMLFVYIVFQIIT